MQAFISENSRSSVPSPEFIKALNKKLNHKHVYKTGFSGSTKELSKSNSWMWIRRARRSRATKLLKCKVAAVCGPSADTHNERAVKHEITAGGGGGYWPAISLELQS